MMTVMMVVASNGIFSNQPILFFNPATFTLYTCVASLVLNT
jgi:hypothetical protein